MEEHRMVAALAGRARSRGRDKRTERAARRSVRKQLRASMIKLRVTKSSAQPLSTIRAIMARPYAARSARSGRRQCKRKSLLSRATRCSA
uniref:Uncharacterized protein n=1 Tax=Peronospora matthiolae TaxID=2874970 RepID=A0AAV1VFU6_9STRA